jgi:pilus assembly protein Flp/PilA
MQHVKIVLLDQNNPTGSMMKSILKTFFADESGATAIEYGLIAAGIALAIITAVNGVGSSLSDKFGAVSTALKPAP